jgi:RNA-directed DNA polymerase
MLGRENMLQALKRVERNGGAPGIDGLRTTDLRHWLKGNWEHVKGELLEGTYVPQAVRSVEIPKPGGKGVRKLGIPSVLDRLLQQALLQVLTPVFDPHFSDRSHGFRPGRSAHGALGQAKEAVASGKRWVVDIDLEKFFDRVNHDLLMKRVAHRVGDGRILRLVRRFLESGMMTNGLLQSTEEGTPQGGPLSPLLSNILLDGFDKELERRGLAFVRYADDCNIYVASRRAGERVMSSLTRFLAETLKLVVNAGKSAVARPWARKFLGYTMTPHKTPKLSVAPESARRLRATLTREFRRGRGHSVQEFAKRLAPILRGWAAYFAHSEVKARFEELDQWTRHKFRRLLWKQWKTPRTRQAKLRQRGLNEAHAKQCAGNGRGPWWNARQAHMHIAVPSKELKSLGLVSTLEVVQTLQKKRTAGYGTVRPVV